MNARVEREFTIDYENTEPPATRSSEEADPPASWLDLDKVLSSIRNMAGISELLRIFGAAVLVASMSMFLLQGWNDGNDVRRYLMLLTQTGLLALAGFALSHGLREAKGARVFFGLALISIPANFTILGALIYSLFPMDGALTSYPDFAAWQVDSIASIGVTLVGALVALVPVTFFGYAVMARHSCKALSLSFLALNMMLLLPVRHSVIAAAIALCGIFYAMHFVRSAVAKDQALKTPEGRFALASMFIPAGIVLVRCVYLYDVESLMVVMLSFAAFFVARQASTFPDRNIRVRRVLEFVSLPIAFVFAIAVGHAYVDADFPFVKWDITLQLVAVAYSLLTLDVVRRTESSRLAKLAVATIAFFSSLCFVLPMAFGAPTALNAVLCLIAGAVMLLAGATLRHWTASVAGSLTIVAGAVFGFESIAAFVTSASWMELSIFGALAIVVGSALDRHGVAIKLQLTHWFGALNRKRQVVALDN